MCIIYKDKLAKQIEKRLTMITAAQASKRIIQQGKHVNIIPVLVIDDVSVAADLAKILIDAEMPILEVTMRTPEALPAMEKMAAIDGAIVAAGTVLHADHAISAQSAGAQILVSPGYTEALEAAAFERDLPLLPGAATATEVMTLSQKGYELLKFFPAEINGGIPALKALSGPFPDVSFCPTGGVSPDNVKQYLSANNVKFVGGSWLVTKEDLRQRNWEEIRERIKQLKTII